MLLRAHDLDRMERLEEVRIGAYFAILPHLKDKISIQQFLPLPSDEHMSKEEVEAVKQNTENIRQALIADFKKRNNIPI